MGFIETIAPIIKRYASKYGVKVISPIIAQAILESASGESELARNAHNYFGIKFHYSVAERYYIKKGSEQNADGSYSESTMYWCYFNSLEDGVHGYFKFLFDRPGVNRYQNLKGISDPKTYLDLIRADGYATSLKYVDNLMAVIDKYDLRKYDKEETKTMKINVHAGHNPDGKTACGAIGLIKESTEARKVKDLVISKLRAKGHTVYDCTVDNGTSQNDVLNKIIAKCNANNVDLDVSIHFNAGANDKAGNGNTTGTEVLLYSATSKAKGYAEDTAKAIAKLGFKNRGIKYNTGLAFLRRTNAPAMLIECCFVDDKDDIARYNAETMANAIVEGIIGETVLTPVQPVPAPTNGEFKVKVTTPNLNIRKGPGTAYPTNGVCAPGTYTITEVNGKWYRLKSGAGWISSVYATRI